MDIASRSTLGSPYAKVPVTPAGAPPDAPKGEEPSKSPQPSADSLVLSQQAQAKAAGPDHPATPCPSPLPISGTKAFAYGFLGVDRPKEQLPPQEEDYTAGQWVGAALKIGGVLALLV